MPTIMTRTPPVWTFTKGARFTRHSLESLKTLSQSLSSENHPDAHALITFVNVTSDPNDISTTYGFMLHFLKGSPLNSVPESPYHVAQAFIQLETSSKIPFNNHKFEQTSDTITIRLVQPSHGSYDDSNSDAVPVKSKHTFSTSDRNANVASSPDTVPTPNVQSDNETGKSLATANVIEPLNTINAQRFINGHTTEYIKNNEQAYNVLQSNEERQTDSNTLLSATEDIMNEIDRRKN